MIALKIVKLEGKVIAIRFLKIKRKEETIIISFKNFIQPDSSSPDEEVSTKSKKRECVFAPRDKTGVSYIDKELMIKYIQVRKVW